MWLDGSAWESCPWQEAQFKDIDCSFPFLCIELVCNMFVLNNGTVNPFTVWRCIPVLYRCFCRLYTCSSWAVIWDSQNFWLASCFVAFEIHHQFYSYLVSCLLGYIISVMYPLAHLNCIAVLNHLMQATFLCFQIVMLLPHVASHQWILSDCVVCSTFQRMTPTECI